MQTLRHTKKYSLLGGIVCVLWLCGVTALLDSSLFQESSLPLFVEYGLNLSLLFAMALLVRCMIQLFRDRPLLQASEQGLYLNLPPKNRGVVPWRHITGFSLSPDNRTILLHLQRHWDLPDRCPERFDIQTDGQGRLFIPLRLGRRAGSPEKVCLLLSQWRSTLDGTSFHPSSPEGDEAAIRRTARFKGRGAHLLLAILSILSSRSWLLWLILFLLAAGILQSHAELPVLWALLIPALPALVLGLLLRRLLTKALAALRRYCAQQSQRSVGL